MLFFVVGMVRTCGSFSDVKTPEHAVKLFIRFALAKAGITYGMELLLALFNIVQGTIGTIMTAAGDVYKRQVLGRVDDEYRGRRYGGFHQESR